MLYAGLRSSILAARERRQEQLDERISGGNAATVFLSLNIPGVEKSPPGASALFSWALCSILAEFPDDGNPLQGSDPLGPYAVISLNWEAVEVKRLCIVLENTNPFARLIDLDVYCANGRPVDRAALGIPPRPCLLCRQPAVECIRLRQHPYREVIGKTDELLASFRD
jgi:holo-ACP synthase